MNNAIRNVVLVCAMCAVAVMCIGLLFYDYIPSGLAIAKVNEYERDSETVEIIDGAKNAREESNKQTSNSGSSSTPTVKTNIVLKEYDVSKADIQRAKINGTIETGKADPFAEPIVPSSGNTSGATGETTTIVQPSDGTYYNSSRVK